MAQERLVPKLPLVWFAWAAAPTVWVANQGFVEEISIKGKRGTLDSRGYADTGQRVEKLDPENEAMFKLFHSRTWTEFSDLLVTELNSDLPTGCRVCYRGSVAISAGNPVWEFWFKLVDIGTIGGPVNTLSKADFTTPIEGMVKRSVDGTTFVNYF